MFIRLEKVYIPVTFSCCIIWVYKISVLKDCILSKNKQYIVELLLEYGMITEEQVSAATAPLRKEIDTANQRVFVAELNAMAPDWQAIDQNQRDDDTVVFA